MRQDRDRTEHGVRHKALWTVWMVAGGLAATLLTYMATGNWGWAILALLASGVVLNFIGQLVVQPIMAATATRHHRPGTRPPR